MNYIITPLNKIILIPFQYNFEFVRLFYIQIANFIKLKYSANYATKINESAVILYTSSLGISRNHHVTVVYITILCYKAKLKVFTYVFNISFRYIVTLKL